MEVLNTLNSLPETVNKFLEELLVVFNKSLVICDINKLFPEPITTVLFVTLILFTPLSVNSCNELRLSVSFTVKSEMLRLPNVKLLLESIENGAVIFTLDSSSSVDASKLETPELLVTFKLFNVTLPIVKSPNTTELESVNGVNARLPPEAPAI